MYAPIARKTGGFVTYMLQSLSLSLPPSLSLPSTQQSFLTVFTSTATWTTQMFVHWATQEWKNTGLKDRIQYQERCMYVHVYTAHVHVVSTGTKKERNASLKQNASIPIISSSCSFSLFPGMSKPTDRVQTNTLHFGHRGTDAQGTLATINLFTVVSNSVGV